MNFVNVFKLCFKSKHGEILFFIAILTHPPELCLGRPEHREEAKQMMEFMKNIDDFAKDADVKLHGFYSNTNEHTS